MVANLYTDGSSLRMWYADGASHSFTNVAWSPTANVYYCIEMRVKVDGSAGVAQAWIDGVNKIDVSGLDTDNYGNIDRIYVGQMYNVNSDIYIDDAVVADAYIGCLGGAPPAAAGGMLRIRRGGSCGGWSS